MPILTQYSIVCQVAGAEPYTVCAYNGTDLLQVLGITQANLPEGHYGWIQTSGVVNVIGYPKAAYVDFGPNAARRDLNEELPKESTRGYEESTYLRKLERLTLLPPLLIEDGPYCQLIREARDVFADGHFYACVAMCGISFERFQRDKAAPHGATKEHKMWQVRSILEEKEVLLPGSLCLCKKMADLRNDYAHGHGSHPQEDALKSLEWMHSFIDNETSLMRYYVIVNGILNRNNVMGINNKDGKTER